MYGTSRRRFDPDRALELLRIGTGDPAAQFHAYQLEAIQHVVENRSPLLLVQRAGWGKSFVYFIASRLLREAGAGPTLLISPLLALMRNQILAAERMGVNAVRIDSSNSGDWRQIEEAILRDEVDVLLVSPERLGNDEFVENVLGPMRDDVGLFVVDEAHCISDWGHDFRPDYRRLSDLLREFPANTRVLMTTATVNDRVLEDLREVVGDQLTLMRGPLGLPSVKLQTIVLPNPAERLAWLAENVPKLEGAGIIYTLTVRDADRVAEWLQECGIDARAYHGRLSGSYFGRGSDGGDPRGELENALLDNEIKCLVATTALGMGFDKPDLGFVIHYQTPGSVVGYYQQVGRAGRGIDAAYGVLLSGFEEDEINAFFIDSSFPSREEAGEILAVLEDAPNGLTIRELESRTNVRSQRIAQTLKILALETPAPVTKIGSRWRRTPNDIPDAFWERVERLTELRRREAAQMKEYVALEDGHMEFLVDAMDGDMDDVARRRKVDLPKLPTTVSRRMVIAAEIFRRGEKIEIKPRKRWPPGAYRRTSVIASDRQAEVGRALCVYGDAGWGHQVRTEKYGGDHRFGDDLLEAVAELVYRWDPQPRPEWLTYIPSTRAESPTADFAQRLAAKLNLPLRDTLNNDPSAKPQKEMRNPAQKVRNSARYLNVSESPPTGPSLLVDDIVDSGWLFTVAAWKLRDAGAGAVFPLAVASKGVR